MKKFLFPLLVLFLTQQAHTQNHKFGKVSKAELEETFYPLDSSANAAYLYKSRKTRVIANAGGIELETKIYVRLKIYNSEGFDWATESVTLFDGGSKRERLASVKAVTYNLVDGNIETTKLSKKNIFAEEVTSNLDRKKFTMPNLKEGCVVEWSYSVYSPFFTSIDDVVVQYEIPVKRYETEIKLLEWFHFNKRQKGYYYFKIVESSKINSAFDTFDKTITIKENNVPAIIEEPYVNNIDNYTAGLELEVASLSAPSLGLYENYATSWEEIGKDIYNSSGFGGELKKTNHLKDDILILKSKSSTLSEKVGNALEFVKSKIKWNNTYGEYPEKGLRKAFKEGAGNIGDINLTLVAVLRGLGLDAYPVLLSTRNNGVPLFPTTKGINYVIAHVKTSEDGYILLDASEKYSLPNSLPLRAMNWQGVIIKKGGSVGYVSLENSATAKEDSSLNYKISEDGFIEGMNRVKYENLYSIDYRNEKAILTEDDLISNIEESNDDIEIINFRLSNKDNIAKPIVEMYSFEREDGAEIIGDKMYLKPLLFVAMDENPFKIDSREYPVDFGTPWRESIKVIVEIPEGFKIESIPEKMGIGLRDETGKFIFSVKELGNKIQISSLLEINRAVISADYYTDLKEFFKQVVAKQTEQIVLSRI